VIKVWSRLVLAMIVFESLVYAVHWIGHVPLEISYLLVILLLVIVIADRRLGW
jgi:hypothetical protein